MKKILSFLVFLFSLTTQAQSLLMPGATWYYRDFNTSPYAYKDGTLELKLTTGTISINNIVCKEVKGTFYGRTSFKDPSPHTVPNYVTYRMYESNQVTYLFNVDLQKFDTIVNFNAAIGDSWFYAQCTSVCKERNIARSKVTVYDTGHVVINGISLKKIVVSPASATVQNIFVERIGGMPGFLFMKQDCNQDGATMGDLSCYSDNTFPNYTKPGIANCIFNTVPVQEQLLAGGFVIYPNPSNGMFKVETTEACELEIFNALGALVYKPGQSTYGGTLDLDLTALAPGIYYLGAKSNNGTAYLKLVKE